MTRKSLIAALFATALTTLVAATTAFAQPAPAPAPAGAAPSEADTQTTANVVQFFEDLAGIAESNKANCAAMGPALNAHLDQNQQMLRDASYSAGEATPEQEAAVTGAATRLGTAAGACYEEEAIGQFFDRFVTLTRDLDQS